MKSEKAVAKKQIVCQKCKNIFEKRKHVKPDPKYCTRMCYAQALKTVQQEPCKVEQVRVTKPQEDLMPMQLFLFMIFAGVVIVTFYLWSIS